MSFLAPLLGVTRRQPKGSSATELLDPPIFPDTETFCDLRRVLAQMSDLLRAKRKYSARSEYYRF